MKKLFFISVLFACFLWNCGKDDGGLDNPGSQQPDSPGENVLVLSVSDLIFNASGGSQEFIVYCAGEWSLTSGSEWCRPEATAGVGEVRVKVSADASTLASDRNVVLTAKSGTLTKSLTVTQKGVNALTLSKDKFDVPQEGGELTIEVNSNMDYTVAVPAAFGSWLKQAEGTKAMQARSYRFTVDAHEGEESREGYIVVGGGELSDTVRIYQAPQTRLVLTEHTCSLTSEAQEFEVELRTNVDYKVVIPDSVENWVSCLPETRALRTDRIRLAVSENRSKTTRTAAVIVKDRNGERADTLHISQKPSHVLLLGQQEAYVKADGGTLAVSLTTDVDYDVVIPESVSGWVSRLETKALRAEELRFTVARNGSGKARTAAIIVKERAGKLSDTLHIRQIAQNDLLLGSKEFDVRAEGEAILPALAEKGDYELVIPDSVNYWISPLKGNPEAFGFFVSPNGVSVRTAVVMVKERISGLCDTVRVRQAQRNSLFLSSYGELRTRARGETVTVTLRTNVDYDVVIPDSVSGWISRVETRAYRSEEIHLAVAENLTGRERTAKVIVLDKEKVLSDTIKLVQATKSPDGIYVGDIVFRTENDLLNFWDAGYTRVQGNVEVASTDYTYNALKTLEKLGDQLVEIDGTLTLNNYNLADLKGLGGLKKITGDLVVKNDNFTTFKGLEALESIGGNFEFQNSTSSSNTFEGLEHLTSIGGNLKLNARSVKGLSDLKTIGGNLSGGSSYEGLSSLTSIGGDFTTYCKSFKGLEKLENIGGDLKPGTSLESFEGLESLKSIGGDLELSNSYNSDYFTKLESFEGLESLKSIGGSLKLSGRGFNAFTSFKGLGSLTSIGEDLEVNSSTSTSFEKLESFEGLESLKSIGGSLKLSGSGFDALASFKGLGSLTSIGGDLELNNNYYSFKTLDSFEGLESLKSIGGSLKLSGRGFDALASFKGLGSLTSIGGDLELNNNNNNTNNPFQRLESFEGLEKLENIGGNLKIKMTEPDNSNSGYTACKSFVSFAGLNGLKRIAGNFEIHVSNDNMRNFSSFDGLDNLQTIGGDFKLVVSVSSYGAYSYVNSLPKLSSFKGLNSLTSIGGDFEVNSSVNCKDGHHGTRSVLNALSSFEGLETLGSIGGNFRVVATAMSISTSNSNCSSSCFSALTSFRGLSGLKTIGGDFEVSAVAKDGTTSSSHQERSASALDALTSFEGLESLQSIGGSLKVTASTAMENTAEPQPALTALKSLASFGGLNALTKINGEGFTATGCPALSDFCTIKNALQNLNGSCNISGNAYNPTKEQILNGQCSQ